MARGASPVSVKFRFGFKLSYSAAFHLSNGHRQSSVNVGSIPTFPAMLVRALTVMAGKLANGKLCGL